MKAITVNFNEGSTEEKQFIECKNMYAKFQECVSKQIDCSNPTQIVEHLTEITSILAMGAVCKATLEYLTDKLSVKALINLKDEDGSANERKGIQVDLNTSGTRTGIDHDINTIILHSSVEILLHHCTQAMDLVNE